MMNTPFLFLAKNISKSFFSLLKLFVYCAFLTIALQSAHLSVFAMGGESEDFMLIDTGFSGSESLGETVTEYEEASLIDIQRMGESADFIEADFYCGNAVIEGLEKCDITDFSGSTCNSLGWSGGSLQCSSDCSEILTSGCFSSTATPTPVPIVVSSLGGNGGSGSGSGNSGGSNALVVSSLSQSGTAGQDPLHSSAPESTPNPENTLTPEITPEESSPDQTISPSPKPETENTSPSDITNIETIPVYSSSPSNPSSPNPELGLGVENSENIGSPDDSDSSDDLQEAEMLESAEDGHSEGLGDFSDIDDVFDYSDFSAFEGEFIPYGSLSGNTEKVPQNTVCIDADEYQDLLIKANMQTNDDFFCWIYILLALLIGFFIRHFICLFSHYKNMKSQKITANMLLVVMTGLFFAPNSFAFTPEIPHTLIYEGRLLSKTQAPLVGNYVMRFSFWNTVDALDSEMLSNGLLNENSVEYGDWTEELPVSFTDQGYFSLILGNQTSITDIQLAQHKYLQVEVKKSSSPDSEYQMLDVDFSNDSIDRKHIASLPYAFNAEESVVSQSAEGSVGNTFVLDPENTVELAGTGNIALQFGETLSKMLSYNVDRGLFSFNDSVEINGDLTLVSDTGSASFSADGLTGDHVYSLPDEDAELVGAESVQVLTNKTIDASQNTIINLSTDSLAPAVKKQIITPLFPNSTFEANASNNQVSVFMGEENDIQYYKISTEETAVQTGTFFITLPLEEFHDFQTGELSFLMKTGSASTAQNSVSIKVKDEDGSVLALLFNQASSGGWETKTIDLSSVTASSGVLLLEIAPLVSAGNDVFLSSISVEYNGK